MAKVMKKAQTGKNVPKGMVESEMFPGKMIPKSKSNYENGQYANMLGSKPKAKVAPKKAQPGRSIGSYVTKDLKTSNYDALDRFKNDKGEDRYYRSTGSDLYSLGKQNQRKSYMNSADSVRSNILTPKEREIMKSQENPMKKGGKMTKKPMKAGGMIQRANGSYSKRGLWDNIRAAKGSGKKPTAQMLKQEKKIKAKTKK